MVHDFKGFKEVTFLAIVVIVLFPMVLIPTAKEIPPNNKVQKGISTSSTPLSWYTFNTPTKGPIVFPASLAPWVKAIAQADTINKGLYKVPIYSSL